jgi:hypothetical protein
MLNVEVRPATLQDGVAVLDLLESVGYYPDPLSFAAAFRKTIVDPKFLVRVAVLDDDRIVGVATLSLRYQLGIGGLLAWLDEIAIAPGAHARRAEKLLRKATVGRARALGAVRVVKDAANAGTPPPRAAQLRALAMLAHAAPTAA